MFANGNLKWERSAQTDLGFDATLLGQKIEITFDYFNKVTNDVLLSLPIPYTSGYFLPADANLGEIKNTGIELSANYRNRVGDFRYSIGGNITTVNNKVVSLGNIPEIITGVSGQQTHRTTVGESLGYFYGFKTDGIYQDDGEVSKAFRMPILQVQHLVIFDLPTLAGPMENQMDKLMLLTGPKLEVPSLNFSMGSIFLLPGKPSIFLFFYRE